jgi:hypothetical protein
LDRNSRGRTKWAIWQIECVPSSTGNPRAAELIEKADELNKMIDADPWDTGQVLGAWLRARKLWCEVTGEPLLW